jgi:heme/copper-type cytochrome/quinol oxidase subunit 1
MAESVNLRRTRILDYVAIGLGSLVLALCCALPILLGSMGIDVHLTESYFVVAHIHWLKLLCVVAGIAGAAVLARTLYTRCIGS